MKETKRKQIQRIACLVLAGAFILSILSSLLLMFSV